MMTTKYPFNYHHKENEVNDNPTTSMEFIHEALMRIDCCASRLKGLNKQWAEMEMPRHDPGTLALATLDEMTSALADITASLTAAVQAAQPQSNTLGDLLYKMAKGEGRSDDTAKLAKMMTDQLTGKPVNDA